MKAVKIKSRLFLGLVKARADLNLSKFVFYHGPKFTDSATFELNEGNNILVHEKYDSNKKTVLYLHGYLENLDVQSIEVIVNAYLKRNDINLIVLDWGELADGNYMLDAVVNAKQLGPVLAKILIEMFDKGLDLDKLHIVGHSLGGQLCSIVAREVYQRTNKTKQIKRITALDPAFPPFYMGGLAKHINKKDAEFVDIIHTDAWIYGAPFSNGTVDFWPNGGKTLQPGCPKRNYKMLSDNDLSSHRRSWWFWAESVSEEFPDKFNAVQAKSWGDFKAGRVLNSDIDVYMGHNCPVNLNISGDYYLQTNGEIPFARGEKGIAYTELAEQAICSLEAESEIVDNSASKHDLSKDKIEDFKEEINGNESEQINSEIICSKDVDIKAAIDIKSNSKENETKINETINGLQINTYVK